MDLFGNIFVIKLIGIFSSIGDYELFVINQKLITQMNSQKAFVELEQLKFDELLKLISNISVVIHTMKTLSTHLAELLSFFFEPKNECKRLSDVSHTRSRMTFIQLSEKASQIRIKSCVNWFFIYMCQTLASRFILILFWYVDWVTGLTLYDSVVSHVVASSQVIREFNWDSLPNVIREHLRDLSLKSFAGFDISLPRIASSDGWNVCGLCRYQCCWLTEEFQMKIM